MNLKRLFSITGLSLFAAVSVGAGVALTNKGKAAEVKADIDVDYGTSGKVFLQLNTNEWKSADSKICLYMFNNDVGKNAWGDFVTPNGTSKYVEYAFSLDFVPKGCIAWRFDPGVEECGSWCFDDFRSNDAIWSTTNDIDFRNVIWLGSYYTDSKWTESGSYDVDAVVKGGASDSWEEATVNKRLTTVKVNESDKLEVYGSVTLPANSYFKVVKGGSVWCNSYSALESIASNFSIVEDGNNNIHNVASGTYEFYFDYDGESVYITDPSIAEADEWAQYFLAHVGCDAEGVAEPTGWSDCASEYAKLSGAAKDIIYSATAKVDGSYVERAVARYDLAIKNHPTLTKFIVSSSSQVRGSSLPTVAESNGQISNEALIGIITVISLISVSSITTLVIIKKKRHN